MRDDRRTDVETSWSDDRLMNVDVNEWFNKKCSL